MQFCFRDFESVAISIGVSCFLCEIPTLQKVIRSLRSANGSLQIVLTRIYIIIYVI